MKTTHIRFAQGRGFTLIELAVVVCVVALLATALLNRINFYQEQAEKAAMESTVGALRSALHLQMASLLAKSKEGDIPNLVRQNPMTWLAEKPPNYVGEYFAPKPQDVEIGNWYFDLHKRNLIYLPRNNTFLRIGQGEPNQVSFQVRLVTASQDSGAEDENRIVGVTLDPVVSYKWF
ncbi:MAG TPA: prepilin-type N-terminal cleavage/methylation domain-containing protein [Noviherbaspirillum sp.]|jgi:general secretion pathway protein G|uniref:prepilin-type N-terminal cleavage/methylation domain-containing protein n=1 Tax=Noviherbaspirillum sp. TaxID=1926288 RepID=UPI002DDCC08D|nr:prepilin-type N-terminal cleavage/methylation domain-containing protein [Noviherbaspirillum sp.]HEV2610306.1 prepilin-type N-terminal cleavage/methylation domain-containing protein [Noviherbaspirillum sp.]